MKTFQWALNCQPEICVLSRVPFSPQNVSREYQHPTFALHQHHYSGRLSFGRRNIDFKSGDFTITPPSVISRYKLIDGGNQFCVHFSPVEFDAKTPLFELPYHISLGGRSGYLTERMRDLVAPIGKLGASRREREVMAANLGTKLQGVLLSLAVQVSGDRRAASAYRKSDDILDDIKERLDQNFTNSFPVADLARSSGLSGHYFSARFLQRFGVTVNTYLLNRRLDMARYLLISTNLPIKEVAFECGIQNANYFNKQFRRVVGCSPSDYRMRTLKSGSFVPVSL